MMSADELADWLRSHHHEDVERVSDYEVASTHKGKPRRYVLANSTSGSLLVSNDYWKLVRR